MALIIAATIPLIPLFMALVGATTRERMDRQLRTLERLAGHFLDVVAGLPHAEDLRTSEGPGAGHWRNHRSLSQECHLNAARHLPVLH